MTRNFRGSDSRNESYRSRPGDRYSKDISSTGLHPRRSSEHEDDHYSRSANSRDRHKRFRDSSHGRRRSKSHERNSERKAHSRRDENGKNSSQRKEKDDARAKDEREGRRKGSEGMPFLLPAYVARIAGSVLTPYHHSLQNRVYIGNIPSHITDDQLRVEFTRYGSVANVAMAWDEERRRSKGWCFIDFEEPKGAADLLKLAPGVVHIGGKAVKIAPPNNPLGATRPPRAMTTEEACLLSMARIVEPMATGANTAVLPNAASGLLGRGDNMGPVPLQYYGLPPVAPMNHHMSSPL